MIPRRNTTFALELMAFYFAIIIAVSSLACYFAYQRQFDQLISEADLTLLRVSNDYSSSTSDFWDIFIPIYQSQPQGVSLLYGYFSSVDTKELSPIERMNLKTLLVQMAQRDDRVRWIALVNQEREVNYYYHVSSEMVLPIPDDFPYWDELENKNTTMAIYGEHDGAWMRSGGESTFAMAGGAPTGDSRDAIVIGYDVAYLQQICAGVQDILSIQYNVFLDDTQLFSSEEEAVPLNGELSPGESGILLRENSRWYCKVSPDSPRNVSIYYVINYRDLFLRSHRNTPLLFLAVLLVGAASYVIYMLFLRSMRKQLSFLQNGLTRIGRNHLDHRIREEFHDADFQQIADDINNMAQSLQESIDRAYYYELRQREAEMQELQSKFNPHFLYNSLEMFRAKCYQNGDAETAELIAQTASIFRGFIDPRKFISIQDELAFSRRYLSLFRARYGDAVEILYDIDTEVLEYGIIRNVFQPMIENYFIHGIDSLRNDNFIRFRGKILDEKTILLTVEDNGLGIELDRLRQLNENLAAPISTHKESYGLKNLSQRLRLFYGEGYGLTLRLGEDGRHLVQEMTIARWTVEDVEQMMDNK